MNPVLSSERASAEALMGEVVDDFLQRLHQGFQGCHAGFQRFPRGLTRVQCLNIGADFGWGPFPKFLGE